MVKLLIIADDFTGALDTGVQFASEGITTKVITDYSQELEWRNQTEEVLVIDAETRHLKADEAYKAVFQIVTDACANHIPYIYKKTDSGMRGNIGSELTAVLDASGAGVLSFIPAFPKMKRITRKGIHYIDGVPIEKSMFGTDPFNPVKYSSIAEIIHSQSRTDVIEDWKNNGICQSDRIVVYDAETDEQVAGVAKRLMERGEMRVSAGCAGFAAALPGMLGLRKCLFKVPRLNSKLLVVCGSINRITQKQIKTAETHGFTRIRMNARQKLESGYFESGEGKGTLAGWFQICTREQACILDTNDEEGNQETREWCERLELDLETMRNRIAHSLGVVLRYLMEQGLDSTVLVTGGDTLVTCMNQMQVFEMRPLYEMDTGIVVSEFCMNEKVYYIISKSGGFGEEELFVDLLKQLSSGRKKNEKGIVEREISVVNA